MNPEFWKNKRVLITGHTGFKGSWLCLLLAALGAKVYGYSLLEPVSDPCLYDLANIYTCMEREKYGTIINFVQTKDFFEAAKPNIVIHMAAQTIVKEGFADPLGTFQTNIIGTANVLQACKETPGIGAVIVVTTDKVYEIQAWPWGYRETDSLGANDPYSTSKACAELVTQSYSKYEMGDMPVVTVRAGNVIGGGDFSYRLIPMIAKWLHEKTEPIIWDPSAVRPWQHVLDCLSGYMSVAEYIYPNGVGGTSWNIGPSDEDYLTCMDVAEQMCEQWGGLFGQVKPKTGSCPDTYPINIILKLDTSKVRTLIGWKPKWNAIATIHMTTQWYEEYYAGENAREICEEHIRLYGI